MLKRLENLAKQGGERENSAMHSERLAMAFALLNSEFEYGDSCYQDFEDMWRL